MKEHRIRQVFEIGMLLKGAHGVVECIGGLALAFVSVRAITHVATFLTQDELAEDPHDFLANHLMLWAQHFSVGSKTFFALYLLSHGVTKIVLVAALLRGMLWAYPASLAVLGFFILYQIHQVVLTQSFGMGALTLFDFGVMWLIWHEYRVMREGHLSPDEIGFRFLAPKNGRGKV